MSITRRIQLSLVLASLWGNIGWPQSPRSTVPVSGPQLYQSKTFQVYTDLPAKDAQDLLNRLETMIQLVSKYFGQPCRKQIRMYVADDLSKWSAEDLANMTPEGLQSIRTGGGLTVTRVQQIVGGPKIDAEAIVFAVSRRGTPLHEAIHAYCGLTFGSTGPVWYSEGMAEVGKYWRDGDKGVNASPEVIDYLKSRPAKPLREIVDNPLEKTGDSRQNYAWRWVLCHLLGYNGNYSDRFKPLGLAMMAEKNTGFNDAYGTQFREIEFEYHLFLKDVEPGYRCDLCTWDWKTRFKPLAGNVVSLVRVDAQKGWQASRVTVTAGQSYIVTIDGEWSTGKEREVSDDPIGSLVGILFNDYELSEPMTISATEPFVAPSDGKLYLRCLDDWGKLADNSGTKTVKIRLESKP